MKLIIAIAIFLIASSSMASSVEYKGYSDLRNYSKAVYDVLVNKKILGCNTEKKYYNISDLLFGSESVTVTDGEQPLLTFKSYSSYSNYKETTILTIETDEAYMNILSVTVQVFGSYTDSVNKGTLKNPNYQDVIKALPVITCKI